MAEKEYIEREAIQKRLNRIVEVNNLQTDRAWFTPYGVNALIEEIPAADVVEVRHGCWEERIVDDDEFDKYGFFRRRLYCSACGNWNTYGASKYCPHCGARMDGGVNDV